VKLTRCIPSTYFAGAAVTRYSAAVFDEVVDQINVRTFLCELLSLFAQSEHEDIYSSGVGISVNLTKVSTSLPTFIHSTVIFSLMDPHLPIHRSALMRFFRLLSSIRGQTPRLITPLPVRCANTLRHCAMPRSQMDRMYRTQRYI
jgi:hypothetical protein